MVEWPLPWKYLSPLIIALWACLMASLERLFPYDKGQRFFRKGFALDFLGYTLIQSYLLGFVIFGFIHWLDAQSGASRLQLVSSWPVALQVLFFFVTHDLYIYGFHRLQHNNRYLWRTHEAHHSVVDIDWLAGSRSHPLEILINQTIEYAPIILLGAHPDVVLIKGVIDATWGMYIHSNINVRAGVLQYIFNGPEMHRWHHSNHVTEGGFNYSTKIAIWDWLFGTAYLPPGQKPPGYGLSGGVEFPDGYFDQLGFAFRSFNDEPEQAHQDSSEGHTA